jgi:primosomal protein N''
MSPCVASTAWYQDARATVSKRPPKETSTPSTKAIDQLIAERRKDKEFQARLRKMVEEDRAILDRLAR